MEVEHTSISFIIFIADEELHVGCGGTNTSHVLQITSETSALYIQKYPNSVQSTVGGR